MQTNHYRPTQTCGRLCWVILCGVTLVLAGQSIRAQTNTPLAAAGPRHGTVVIPDESGTDVNVTQSGPSRPDQPGMPPQVKARIERFKVDAKAYLEKQEELKKKLQGASDQERAALREQIKALREQWLERSRELRQEYKERKAELETKLKDHKELFDDIRNSALDRRDERPRRGGD